MKKYAVMSQAAPWRNASDSDVKALFGIKPNGKYPDEGIVSKVVPGIELANGKPNGAMCDIMVWVEPKDRTTRHMQMRVWCACPGCNRYMAFSRLPQHRCKGMGA